MSVESKLARMPEIRSSDRRQWVTTQPLIRALLSAASAVRRPAVRSASGAVRLSGLSGFS